MPPTPEVLTGLRAPRAVRLEDAMARAGTPESAQGAPPLPVVEPDGPTVYVSKYPGYRVQITAPATFANPATGQKALAGKLLSAQFDEYVYRNTERDPELRALIDRTLQSNPYFGKFGDGKAHYWLASDQKATMERAKIDNALKTLKSLPREVVEQHIASLKLGEAQDHELPPVAPPVE